MEHADHSLKHTDTVTLQTTVTSLRMLLTNAPIHSEAPMLHYYTMSELVSEQFLNGTTAHIRLFSAIHSFRALHGMVDLHKSWK